MYADVIDLVSERRVNTGKFSQKVSLGAQCHDFSEGAKWDPETSLEGCALFFLHVDIMVF